MVRNTKLKKAVVASIAAAGLIIPTVQISTGHTFASCPGREVYPREDYRVTGGGVDWGRCAA
jgi:hypothetical protein